jgi:hypothetical protein
VPPCPRAVHRGSSVLPVIGEVLLSSVATVIELMQFARHGMTGLRQCMAQLILGTGM